MEQILTDAAAISEVVAFLKMPMDKSVFSNSFVVESIKASPQATVLPYVYHSEFSRGADVTSELSRNYDVLKDAISMSLADFADRLSRDSDIFNNGLAETFEITISGDASDGRYFNEIAKLSSSFPASNSFTRSPMMFIAMDAPHPQAAQPKRSANYGNILSPISTDTSSTVNLNQYTDNHVSRVLASKNTTSSNSSTTSTDNGKGIYYRPEGAEYSIYYASTYLYITPDIFTGIMTGIFVTFTLLIGKQIRINNL
jgi:hypothetical protein